MVKTDDWGSRHTCTCVYHIAESIHSDIRAVRPVSSASNAMQNLSLQEKVDLFCSLFKGRDDVFA